MRYFIDTNGQLHRIRRDGARFIVDWYTNPVVGWIGMDASHDRYTGDSEAEILERCNLGSEIADSVLMSLFSWNLEPKKASEWRMDRLQKRIRALEKGAE